MTLKTNKRDITRNERQARRREREKQWLIENGWQSWEALHTSLMNGKAHIELVNYMKSKKSNFIEL